jgi:hypothetical protein
MLLLYGIEERLLEFGVFCTPQAETVRAKVLALYDMSTFGLLPASVANRDLHYDI